MAIRLAADPIPTLTATSATIVSGSLSGRCSLAYGCAATGSIAGDFFTLGGTGYEGVPEPFGPYGNSESKFGFSSPFAGGFPGNGEPVGAEPFEGTVTRGGTTIPVQYPGTAFISAPDIAFGSYIPGSTTVTASAGGIAARPMTPSSPTTILIVPARITGGFEACPHSPFETEFTQPCTLSPAVANISVDL